MEKEALQILCEPRGEFAYQILFPDSGSACCRLTNSLAVFGWTHFPLMKRMAEEVVRRIDEFSSEVCIS